MELGTVQLTVAIGEREDHTEEVTGRCGLSAKQYHAVLAQLAGVGMCVFSLILVVGISAGMRTKPDSWYLLPYLCVVLGAVAAWVARIAVHPKVACRCFWSTRLCMQHRSFRFPSTVRVTALQRNTEP